MRQTFESHAGAIDGFCGVCPTTMRFAPRSRSVVAQRGAIDAGTPGVATPLVASANGRIGRGFGNTNIDTRFRGDILEIVVFTKALSETEVTDVKTYLQRHWGM